MGVPSVVPRWMHREPGVIGPNEGGQPTIWPTQAPARGASSIGARGYLTNWFLSHPLRRSTATPEDPEAGEIETQLNETAKRRPACLGCSLGFPKHRRAF